MSQKLIRIITIFAIAALFVGAWYSLITARAEEDSKYNYNLNIARDKFRDGLYDDAADAYLAALGEKESLELRCEIADFYNMTGNSNGYLRQCSDIIQMYPKSEEGYVRYATYYSGVGKYYEVYETIRNAQKRGITSERLNLIADEFKYVYELVGRYADVGQFSTGLIPVMNKNGYWGYIYYNGAQAIPEQFEVANVFTSNGYATTKRNGSPYMLIDTTGREKISGKTIEEADSFSNYMENKIAIKTQGKYGYYTIEFEKLFGDYDFAGSFNGNAAAVMEENAWYIIDGNGNRIVQEGYEDIKLDEKDIAFRRNRAFVKKDGKYHLIDSTGNEVCTAEWDDADVFNASGYAAVKENNKWGFIDENGKLVSEYIYDGAKSFSNGFAPVQMNGKWGYISETGLTEAIDCSFDDAADFNDGGSAFVRVDDVWRLLKLYSKSTKK